MVITLQGYATAFILCVIAFVEGILFTFFCFELIQEQMESIGDNQSYIEEMKEVFGRPLDFFDSTCLTLGNDWQWWLAPTHPVLKINYLERVYPLKDMKKLKAHDFKEEDSDPNEKYLFLEQKKAGQEKVILVSCIVIFVAVWIMHLRYEVQKYV